jgi:transposase
VLAQSDNVTFEQSRNVTSTIISSIMKGAIKMIGGVTLNQKEQRRVDIMERYIRKEIKVSEVSKHIGLSVRQCKRIKEKYKKEGVKALAHGNRGKRSNNRISGDEIMRAMDLIKNKYPDFGPTFALEKLHEHHGINFSVETLRKAMIENKIWNLKQRKKAHVHQPRNRRSAEGELVQLDGSEHRWFEDRGHICTLIAYIDDATSKILYAEFFKSESTWAYFNSFKILLEEQGKPVALYSDKHGIFRVNRSNKGSSSVNDSQNSTQFGRAMKDLNIEVIHANTPQAKGRVERAFGTLQDRLVKELRLKNISSIKDANKFLPSFIKKYNSKFSKAPAIQKNAFRELLPCENLSDILTIKDKRIISKNLTIQFNNKIYLIKTNKSAYLLRKATVLVSENEKAEISISYKGNKLTYEIIEKIQNTQPISRKEVNQRVDDALERQKKKYVPSASHPYKNRSYQMMLKKKELELANV